MLIMDLKFMHLIFRYFILVTVLLKTNDVLVVSANTDLEDEVIRQNASELKTCEDREDMAKRFDLLETKFNLYEEDRNQLFQYFNTITEIMKRHMKLEEENNVLKNTLDAVKNEMDDRLKKIENKSDSLKQNIDGLKNDITDTSEKVEDRNASEQIWQNVLAQIREQINNSRTCFGVSVEEINENIKALRNDTNEQKEEITILKRNFQNLPNQFKAVSDDIEKQSNDSRTFLEALVDEVIENIKALRNDTNEQKEEIVYLKRNFENIQTEVTSVADEIDDQSNKTRTLLEVNIKKINENIKTLMNDTNKEKEDLENEIKAVADGLEPYSFSYHTFKTCGKVGSDGPSLEMCRRAYNQNIWMRSGLFYRMEISGVQQWVVPKTSSYRIYAFGANGGSGHAGTFLGGKGAKMVGTFHLPKGTVVNIVCGQSGSNGTGSNSGGGGGGTFVYTGNVGGDGLLIAAGGGGGAGEEDTHNGYNGQNTEYSQNADGNSKNETEGNGGSGYGGIGGTRSTAGAGWKSNGNPMIGTNQGKPGTRWIGGIYGAHGGFGGGGSNCNSNGGGGAGGFTGGSSTSSNTRTMWGGGGGGSYNDGFDQENESGQNDDDGYVIIKIV